MIVLFLSGMEIFIALLAFLLLFGAKRLPELARGLGKGMREFKKASEEIKRELEDSTGGMKKEIDDINKTVNKL